jgi:4-hydroxybenzoate polyprenyltransferase
MLTTRNPQLTTRGGVPRIFEHLLPLLQLTRMALVFTAVSNSMAAMLLLAKWTGVKGADPWDTITVWNVSAIVLMSIGMYGFGMSLNDIIDRRRDSQISPGRPLPSGRIGVVTAHIICALMAALALAGAAAYGWGTNMRWPTMACAVITLALISFYDLAGKYLVAPGLVSLGLIRFFHAVIAAPQVPLLWHPLLLLNHVVILSAVCYKLEDKRPTLTRGHWIAVLVGLIAVNGLSIGALAFRRSTAGVDVLEALWITPGLLYVAGAIFGFVVAALLVIKRSSDRRAAGQTLMLLGLLWLIVYDVAIVAGYVNFRAAALMSLLLPIAYLAVQLMRWWARLVAISQPPKYIRAR